VLNKTWHTNWRNCMFSIFIFYWVHQNHTKWRCGTCFYCST